MRGVVERDPVRGGRVVPEGGDARPAARPRESASGGKSRGVGNVSHADAVELVADVNGRGLVGPPSTRTEPGRPELQAGGAPPVPSKRARTSMVVPNTTV